jgi:DNA (cytosine-5)-methyltransferase 1
MKVLNLYAGLGGNRKLWENVEVTAVEIDANVAEIYRQQQPGDTVIIGDAHQYLIEHYKEFDFIWSSPPCQSHSRLALCNSRTAPKYPDMSIYQEIIFLTNYFNGPGQNWVVENVRPYYDILIPAYSVDRHLFWANYQITATEAPSFRGNIAKAQSQDAKQEWMDWLDIHYGHNVYLPGSNDQTQALRNCVHPLLGYDVFQCRNSGQNDLFGAP